MSLEAALPAGVDPRRYAHVLAKVHDATLAGTQPPVQPRSVISASWKRMLREGVDPDRGREVRPLAIDEVEHRRRTSGLADALPILRDALTTLAEDAKHIMVVVDADGFVLWRDGSSTVRRHADGLGFTEGASWREDVVGTNAIGTALVARKPLQVYSAEHYVRTHHTWTCSCAPVHDPRTGALLGAVDVSGPASTVNASALALVDAAAKLAESQLRTAHLQDLQRLRAVAGPALTGAGTPAVVTDPHGWIAAASGIAPVDRVALPADCATGAAWLPAFGQCQLEPVPGGWLVRVIDDAAADVETRVVVDVRSAHHPTLTVHGAGSAWTHPLSPRHAELLYVLARHPDGRTAAQLAADMFDDESRTVTIRAEMSRLRRHLGGVLAHRPYRFADGVTVELHAPPEPDLVLPHSLAPGVRTPA